MTLQDLSLPVDVPWKLVATSQDMLATRANPFPNATWKPSLAIFAYDPDLSDLPEEFPDRALTFLKVSCSITSYTPPCAPAYSVPTPPPPPTQPSQGDNAPNVYLVVKDLGALNDTGAISDTTADLASTSFPCSGALLQVAIYPRQDGVDFTDLSKLAVFTAFQPQKRELVEAATESGESLTQSKSDVSTRKGLTTTDSTEDLDIFTGANLKIGGSYEGGVTGQWGTIKKSGTENTNATTTDSSRESRETSSHTTSLSQLYHLLNSYHVGTNRAIFFLQPRPHTLQQKDQFTFIDGPQEIEGVQEFFLVVSRPKTQAEQAAGQNPPAQLSWLQDFCVDALLYTAHLDSNAIRKAMLEPKTMETPWYELWAAASEPKALSQGSLGNWIATPGDQYWLEGEAFMSWHQDKMAWGLDPYFNQIQLTAEEIFNLERYLPKANKAWNTLPNWPKLLSHRFWLNPAAADQQAISIGSILGPGWRIDRTRGQGGYDLWEDPDNTSQTPFGEDSPSKSKPQAFIDILDTGPLDDPDYIYPDSQLHFQVLIWPKPQEDKGAWYHGRIKLYLVRDEQPSDARNVTMFVIPRAVSTCPESMYFNLDQDTAVAVAPGQQLDIVKQATIKPVSVALHSSIAAAASPAASPATVSAFATASTASAATAPAPTSTVGPISPAKSTSPDTYAIGTARAKMANEMIPQVRDQLQASLAEIACEPKPLSQRINFWHTDFVFNRLAPMILQEEAKRLTDNISHHTALAAHLTNHPAWNVLQLSTKPSAVQVRQVAPLKRRASIAATPLFPVLTLAHKTLKPQNRRRLVTAGIKSGLDFLNLSVDELAMRLKTTASEAGQIRMQALGFK